MIPKGLMHLGPGKYQMVTGEEVWQLQVDFSVEHPVGSVYDWGVYKLNGAVAHYMDRFPTLAKAHAWVLANTRDAIHGREYPANVDESKITAAGKAVFARFPGDSWRKASLREVIGVILSCESDSPEPVPS